MKKGKIIGLLAGISCVAVAAGAGMVTNATASASQTLAGKDVSSFAMEYGAGVRIPTTDDANNTNGIRFTATLEDAVYAELEALETDTTKVNYGMMIVPANYVQENALTPENVFGANGATKKYTFDACTAEEGQTCPCGVKHITKLTYEKLTVGKVDKDATEDTAIIRGSLVNIHDDNRTRDFVGMAYIEYDVNGTKTYAFANYADGLVKNNTRSMTYVTQLHLNGGGEDSGLTARYITPYMDKEHKYTIEHYFPNSLGEYGSTADKTETKWGTLNQTVYAKNIAKVTDVEVTDEQREKYSTAVMNGSENACTSAPVYVNGNTVLKCYYKEVSNVLFDSSDSNDVELLTQANSDNAGYGRSATVTKAEDPTDSTKTVAKVSSIDTNEWRDGLLDMNFAPEKLQAATDANWDYLTVRMYVEAAYENSGYYENITDEVADKEKNAIEAVDTVHLVSNNIALGNYNIGEWVNVVIPKAKLNTITYKEDGKVNWTSQVTGVKKTGTLTKADFDETFNAMYSGNGSDYLFYIGTFSETKVADLADCTAKTSNAQACHDVRITYYIDTITWGVDYKAPVVEASTKIITPVADGAEVSYTPAYTVTDDILPGNVLAANGVTHTTPIRSSSAIYEVVGGARANDALEATNGAYTLIKGKSYELDVTVEDWSVADMDGNKKTYTYPLTVASGETLTSFDSEADTALLSSSRCSADPTIEYMETYGEKSGVVKMATTLPTTSNDGADLNLHLDDLTVEEIINAYNNNTNFTLKITVNFDFGKVDSSNYNAFGVAVHFGKTHFLAGDPNNLIAVNTKDENNDWAVTPNRMLEDNWYTLVLTKELLYTYANWQSDDLIRQQLTGERYLMAFGSDWTVDGKSGSTFTAQSVTYYLDEISYSVA